MDEEDDSGYEARSTVTTSNSICQTDLQQLVYNSLNRPATVNYTNYSNYNSHSLFISSTSLNELQSPRSNLTTSRPQSSAYSTISSCSLNNRPFCHSTFEQQHPSLEEYQPLDQFRSLDQFEQNYQSSNMSTNRSLNFRTLSPDYEQDWSAGEQDEDYVIQHVRPVNRQIDHPTNRNLTRRNRYRLDDDDLEQDDNEIEYLDRRNFESDYAMNLEVNSDENLNENVDENVDENDSNKNGSNNHHQLVNILNSPLDRTPFSSPLSLPSSNLSNSNESSNNSSPKIKLPESSFSETSSLNESSVHSKNSSKNKSDKNSTSPAIIKQESPNPIYLSEEEFTTRKSALRERINRTEMLLNSINNNCNRFRTITSAINSRSQELLNQRRQAEIEIDNIVQQNSTSSEQPFTNSLNKLNSFNKFQQQQPQIERDLKSTTIENEESHIELISDSPTTVENEVNKKEVLTDQMLQSNNDKIDKTQKQQTGDSNNKLTATTMDSRNLTNYKDNAEPTDHLNKLNLKISRNVSKLNSTNDLSLNKLMNTTSNEWPTPNTNLPSIKDSNKPINNNQLLSTKNNESKNNLATTEFKASDQNRTLSEPQSSLDKKLVKSDSKSSFRSEIKSDFENDSETISKSSLKKKDSKSNLTTDSKTSSRNKFRPSSKINLKDKFKNNLKNNLIDIKSDLSDLSDLLNIQTVPKTTSLPTDVKLMSFTVQKEQQPNKSVNTEIDSRLMDHILSKICAQREMQSKNDSSNIPSTSKQQTTIDEHLQQSKKVNRLEHKKTESTESKQCQTDKIQNQDASVSVNEYDLELQKKQIIKSKNDEKKQNEIKERCNSSEQGESSKSELCENCKKRCYSSQILIECNRQFNRQEPFNHCCVKCVQETCASIFQPNHSHLPVCINTFNHNTFTSLPNLTAHSQPNIARIEQGTNTEPNIDKDLIEVNSNKKDKQTQCILGLSLEQQQREYIEQQQQKYLRLKEELKAKEISENEKVQKIEDKDVKDINKLKERNKRDIEIDQEKTKQKNVQDKDEKSLKKEVRKEDESSKNLEKNIDKDVLIDSNKSKKYATDESEKDKMISNTIQNESFDKEIASKEEEDLSDKDETLSEKNENPLLNVTLPVKLPFKSDKIERKLIDLKKEKNVKTHSKIIIEFSGKHKRERSAVDSFTKLDKDGKITKKTLVSNTKEISVPIKAAKDENDKNETTNKSLNIYTLSSTPQYEKTKTYSPTLSSNESTLNETENQLISNQNTLYLNKKDQNQINTGQKWKEASHSEITNEMSADPLLDENNKAHPTKSITLSTITTFDRTVPGEPQRIDHSNRYQRCFENPSIHEPLIESNLTMLDEPSGQDTASNMSSSSSNENLVEEAADENLKRINNLRTLNKERVDSKEPKKDYQRDKVISDLSSEPKLNKNESNSSESRSVDSRLSNSSQSRASDQTLVGKNDEPDINVNSRSASRVSFNLPDNYRDTDSSQNENNFNQPINNYSTEILESNLDNELDNQETDLNRMKSTKRIRSLESSQQQTAGLLETELDDHLFYDAEDDHNYDLNNLRTDHQENDNNVAQPSEYYEQKQDDYSQSYIEQYEKQKPKSSKSKLKEKKSKSSKKKSDLQTSSKSIQPVPEHTSDQSSIFSISTTQPRSKQLNDSGFLSPEIYHSSPYELAYKQVNKDENSEKIKDKKQNAKTDKKKSSSDKRMDKKSKHKNLLKNGDNGLQFTEHSSNTEIITRLTKTSYPSNYSNIDSNLQPKLIEKQLKQLKRNKMVLDQILNSPEIKSTSSKSEAKKSSRGEKKKKTGCKISSQITMDLPIYKEEKIIHKTAKSVSCPVKSLSLEELDKERDLDRKSVVSQHSYSQKSGEFNTMTKFQRYKPSSKYSKKNKSSIHLNQPDETNWEYTMQCNCVNGSKANVLTNVKHRRILFFPLQQYETSL